MQGEEIVEKRKGCDLAHYLIHKFWGYVKHQQPENYSRLIACQFQGLDLSGYYNRHDQLASLENVRLEKFKIKNLAVTDREDTLIVSYIFHAKGSGISSGSFMETWKKVGSHCKWRLVSHAHVPYHSCH